MSTAAAAAAAAAAELIGATASGAAAAAAAAQQTEEGAAELLHGLPNCTLISGKGEPSSERPYRHHNFNRKVSAGSRLKQEVRSMCRLRKVGLLVPAPYYVDADSSCLYMEKVAGAPLQQLLQQGSLDEAGLAKVLAGVGRLAAKMHDAGVIHGDLAASKLLVREDKQLVLLDLSMSLSSTYAEDKGVDLLLLDQDLEQIAAASQAYRDKQLFDMVMESYKQHSKQWSAAFNKFAEARTKARANSKKAATENK